MFLCKVISLIISKILSSFMDFYETFKDDEVTDEASRVLQIN